VYITISCCTDNTANSNTGNFKQYYLSPSVAGVFSAWGTPTEIGGVAAAYPNSIAGFVFRSGSNYRMLLKDENPVGSGGKQNVMLTSTALASGWTVLYSGDFMGIGQNEYEGVHCVSLGDSSYRIFGDKFTANEGIFYWDTTDDFATFSAPAAISGFAAPVPRNAIVIAAPATGGGRGMGSSYGHRLLRP